MFYIFECYTEYGAVFLFTTSDWFSSDFDTLYQLCEVGLDDPDKVTNHLTGSLNETYPDCKFLFQTDNLETAHVDFPEWFI